MTTDITVEFIENKIKDNLDYLNHNHLWLGQSCDYQTLQKKVQKSLPELLQKAKELITAATTNAAYDFKKNNISYHSRRDPLREAARHTAEIRKKRYEHLVLVGSGLGYILKQLQQEDFKGEICLIEPDIETFFLLSALVNYTDISSRYRRVFVLLPGLTEGDTHEETLDPLFPFLKNKAARYVGVIIHRPSFQAYYQLYQPYYLALNRLLDKRSINQATIIKFQYLWNKNISLNAATTVKSKTLEHLIKEMSENPLTTTCVIAGAGPSLDMSFEELKKHRNKFYLIAADTAFIPLVKAEIIPDLVIAADPQWVNHHFVLNSKVTKTRWLLDPVVCPALSHFLEMKGANIYFWDNPFKLDLWLRSHIGDRGEIAHGGSVSTNAFDLALKFNCQHLILTGQDLSFPDRLAHIPGAALETAIYRRIDRFFSFEMHNHRQMTALPEIKVESIIPSEQGKLFTNAKLKVFIEWFENQAGLLKKQNINLINATRRGVKLKGFRHISLNLFFEEHSAQNSSPAEKPAETSVIAAIDKKNEQISGLLKEAETIVFQLNQLIDLYRDNLRIVNKKNLNDNDIKRMNKNDIEMKLYSKAAGLVELGAQQVILSITEKESSDDTLASSKNLYRALQQSAEQLIYLFKKITNTVKMV